MRTLTPRPALLAPWLPALGLLLAPALALARAGGGEHFSSGGDDSGGDDDGAALWLLIRLIELAIRYPKIGVPLLLLFGAFYLYGKLSGPQHTTQRALQQRQGEQRTQVSDSEVQGWVNALKFKDARFELQPVLERVRKLFLATQEAWFQRDMAPVRPFLSDATYQRFNVQLGLLAAQGVRDAVCDVQVLDVRLIGLRQSEWFDTIHVRVRARMRDADVPAGYSDAQALEAARRAPLEAFTEVWTFVRKPGVQTRQGQDASQGQCPQCGAPFTGGATNACEYCGAIVNSGNYDWTLSEITQGSEHLRHHAQVDGMREARLADPALNLEILEDRASLLFWKWVDAQSRQDVTRLSKVAHPDMLGLLGADLEALRQHGRRRVFLECAVGAVTVRALETHPEGYDQAHVEVRWSARMGVVSVEGRASQLPTVPRRYVLTLLRKHGAATSTEHGMSTDRCPQCHGPLTDSAATSCDYCGTPLASGERDWVLSTALPFEAWDSRAPVSGGLARRGPSADEVVTDVQERERLLYMMAALACADGSVGAQERQMLKLCSQRWGIPWKNVEMALNTGPQLFERLVPRGSAEAEVFLRHLVDLALVDGRVDKQERRMLETAAAQLGVSGRLPEMLGQKLAG